MWLLFYTHCCYARTHWKGNVKILIDGSRAYSLLIKSNQINLISCHNIVIWIWLLTISVINLLRNDIKKHFNTNTVLHIGFHICVLFITVIAVTIVICEVISQFIARELLVNRIYFAKIRPSYDICVIKSRWSDFKPNVYFIWYSWGVDKPHEQLSVCLYRIY